MGVKLAMSAAYHPQTDGQTERMNRTMIEMIRAYITSHHSNWDVLLPALEFAYNSSKQASTLKTPFESNYGYNPLTLSDLITQDNQNNPASKRYLEARAKIIEEIKKDLALAQSRQAKYANKKRQPVFMKVGDKVLLSTKHITLKLPHKSAKFAPRYLGPFEITQAYNHVTFALDLPTRLRRLNNAFHASLLRPYNDPTLKFPSREFYVPDESGFYPEIAPAFEVERILDHEIRSDPKSRKRIRYYKVRWAGYDESEDSWEKITNFYDLTPINDWHEAQAQAHQASLHPSPTQSHT
jgi:hypothetical protein